MTNEETMKTVAADQKARTEALAKVTKAAKPAKAKAKAKAAPKAKAKKPAKREPRQGTKQAKVIAMLESAKGATYAEIAKAMDWLPHTTRAMVSVALEKKLGLKITRTEDEKRGMVMRIK
jgi:hypothetical protein